MIHSPSYMKMQLDLDGKDPLELRIPTFWDEVRFQWIGAIQTPITKKMIVGYGKNSFELQISFNVEMSKWFQDSKEMSDEILSMFKTTKEWDDEDKNNYVRD